MSPLAPAHPCAVPRCPHLVPSGVSRCPEHARQQHERDRPNVDMRRRYRQARWRRLRASVLSDNPLCVDCQAQERITVATEVHHRVKHGGDLGLFYQRENLEGLCAMHHAIHTGRGE